MDIIEEEHDGVLPARHHAKEQLKNVVDPAKVDLVARSSALIQHCSVQFRTQQSNTWQHSCKSCQMRPKHGHQGDDDAVQLFRRPFLADESTQLVEGRNDNGGGLLLRDRVKLLLHSVPPGHIDVRNHTLDQPRLSGSREALST